MPYWLSLLAERTDPDRAHGILDGAAAAAHSHDDRWWLPEVLRQRARFRHGPDAVAALHEALALAEEQGSTTLAERCRLDLDSLRTPAERTPS
jgi:hypothetical protein